MNAIAKAEPERQAALDIFGHSYPVLKELRFGWYLVAHPNGPAIGRAQRWQYLGHLSKMQASNDVDIVPLAIRYDAISALMEWAVNQPTWPKL